MDFELQAISEPGQRFVALAAEHAADFAGRAAQHDREASFPAENFQAMRRSGFLAGPVPRELGGLGAESVHDAMVAMSRLARGDSSTALAATMHIAGAASLARMLPRAKARGDAATAALLETLLRQLGAGELIMCFPRTETGTDLNSPMTEATPTEGGYVVNGRKSFGTLSPGADLFFPTVRVPRDAGGYDTAVVMIPRGAPGLEVKDNWDAMGMRASGSNDVLFSNCFVPGAMLFLRQNNYGALGRGAPDSALFASLPLFATFLGIAEAARGLAVEAVKGQRKGPNQKRLADRASIQHIIAEIEIDLSASRAITERLGRLADAFLARHATDEAPPQASNALLKEIQCMKHVVTRKAIDVVDRAMTACGGITYTSRHPLSRLYRDVRAGPFLQPFAPYEAFEYIGRIALGLGPSLDR